jgi:formate-dependent nitrite reductase membrane component NrfD
LLFDKLPRFDYFFQMTTPPKPKATEKRLDEIREAAAASANAPGTVPVIGESLARDGRESYYGLPVLKAPTWTWEVPLYFFFGGIAGVSACIAFFAHLFHADPALVRMCLWMGLVGAAICPVLLIMDLGRPSRFLNMLRVFKIQSAMSLGAWILVAFSGCTFFAVLSFELLLRGFAPSFFTPALWLAEGSGAVMGLLLASYTGVLIGATAIPVWSENHKLLPAHFLTSGLGGAAGILELAGFLIPATQFIGFAAAGIETLVGAVLELQRNSVNAPLHRGRSGWTMRIGGVLEGPVALAVRILWGRLPAGREVAAICFLVGALLSRYAWIWAGHASGQDPEVLFELQRKS